MGLKRKASELEEFPISPEVNRRSATPSLTSSPGSLASTTITELSPYNSNYSENITCKPIGAIPYLNSRTRKRYRDGRPSEETIHENTLRKLFDGQRQQHGEMGSGIHSNVELSSLADSFESQSPTLVDVPMERNQRSIESFFGNQSSTRTHIVPHSSSVGQVAMSTLTCEDCFSPLFTKPVQEGSNSMMLDMDGTVAADSAEVEGSWACASCAKRVCDICAVRGDYRVCLECAVPGGGTFKSTAPIQERRWVGGIGWM